MIRIKKRHIGMSFVCENGDSYQNIQRMTGAERAERPYLGKYKAWDLSYLCEQYGLDGFDIQKIHWPLDGFPSAPDPNKQFVKYYDYKEVTTGIIYKCIGVTKKGKMVYFDEGDLCRTTEPFRSAKWIVVN